MWRALALSCLLTATAQDAASVLASSGQPAGSPAQGPSPASSAAPTSGSAASQSGGDLNFGPVSFAGYDNYVLRDNHTAVQIVLSNDAEPEVGHPARFITAFHRANTGALVYFVPQDFSSSVTASLDRSSVKSLRDADEQRGVEGDLKLDNDVRFGVTLIGSVRTLRDYTESGGKLFNSVFNYTLGEVTRDSVQLVRHWLNGTTVQYLTFKTGNNAGLAVTKRSDGPPGIRFWRSDNKTPMTLHFRSHFNWTGTTPETPWVEANGLGPDDLFLKPTGSGNTTATGGPAGRPMSESTALVTATTYPAGMTTTNPIYTLHENQTRQVVPNVAFTPTPNATVAGNSAAPAPVSSQPVQSAVNGTGSGNRTSGSTSANLDKVLSAIHGQGAEVAQQMSFLTYDTEFLAGGWRFLTYFGRDTLIAARLMLPVLSSEAVEAVMAAAIERTNSTSGELCHEETVGDYASYLNAKAGQPELGNKPVYAYTMVDTDFLLLPLVAAYATAPQGEGRLDEFLGRDSSLVEGTYKELLETNAEHVIELAREFAVHPRRENLVKVRSYPVGNWRDSAAGLGWGSYPFDVNVALVPAALRAISQLHRAGLIKGKRFNQAGHFAGRWESRALKHFHVNIAHVKSKERLDNYVKLANLSDALLYGAGSLNGSQTADGYNAPGWAIGVPNKTHSDAGNQRRDGGNDHKDNHKDDHDDDESWSDGEEDGGRPSSTYPRSQRDTYYALSLRDNLKPVHIQHSDLSFLLLYGQNVKKEAVIATVQALQPYPRGLLTNAGMLVANAAFSFNDSDAETFSNRAYHGAVAWGWQQGMMAAGVGRQLALCGAGGNSLESVTVSSGPSNGTEEQPKWCSDRGLVLALHAAQGRLWDSIAGSKDVLYTEVWSPVFQPPKQPRDNATLPVTGNATAPAAGDSADGGSFAIGDLGKLSPEGTEGDAIQLWSYGFLAQIDPRTGTPVANWKPSNDTKMVGDDSTQSAQSDALPHADTGTEGVDTGNGVGGVSDASAKKEPAEGSSSSTST